VVVGELGSIYRHPTVALWSLWWVLGYSAMILAVNYYQLQLYEIDPKVEFGFVEVLIEVGSSCGKPNVIHH
jgi:hypothetical protein